MQRKPIHLKTPVTEKMARSLNSGDSILITGTIYTARDAAHMRLNAAIDNGETLPVDLKDQIIYYVGPSPAKPGQPIGACGPTTSYRMDDLTIPLLERGLRVMIGKGERDDKVVEAMKKLGVVYMAAIGGAGALLSTCVTKSEVVAYADLGAEAIHRLTVVDFPVMVVIDAQGNNLYLTERAKYAHQTL